MVRLFPALLIGLAVCLSAPGARAQATAEELMAMTDRVLARSDELSRIWPGFWPPEQPFILYAPRTGAVFAGAASSEGPSFRAGPLEGANFRFVMDFPSGAPNTLMFEVEGPGDDLSTLFHEQFHDFQHDTFVWRGESGGEYVDLGLIQDLTAFTIGIELERRVLADALAAPDALTRRELARAYLALRREREEGVDPFVVATERHREWTEGTAEYVGIQASVVVRGGAAAEAANQITTSLRADLLSQPGDYGVNIFRWRAYGVGAALAWLLDDLGVPEWRADVQAGTPLDMILEGAVGLADADALAAVRSAYDVAALSRQVAPAVAAAMATPLDRTAFLATAPRLLVIEMDLPADQLKDAEIGFHSPQMTPLADGAMALPNATRVSVQSGELSLQVAGQSVLFESPVSREPGRGMFRFSILLSDLAGLETLAPGPLPEPLEVEMDGVALRIPAGAVIEMDEASITIRVR